MARHTYIIELKKKSQEFHPIHTNYKEIMKKYEDQESCPNIVREILTKKMKRKRCIYMFVGVILKRKGKQENPTNASLKF